MLIAYRFLAAAVALALQIGPPEAPFKTVGVITGTDTQIEQARALLVGDSGGWLRLWHEHKGQFTIPGGIQSSTEEDPAPNVDFTKDMVLAVFDGQQSNIAGFEVSSAKKGDKSADVHLRPVTLPATGASLVTSPYILVVFPRTKKPLEVYLDIDTGSRLVTTLKLPDSNRD